MVSLSQRTARCNGFSVTCSQPRPFPDDEPGLRAAENLVAAEGDDVGTEGDLLGHDRFFRESELAEIDQRAAAEVLHHREVVRLPHGDEFPQRHVAGKSDDAVIAGVHLEQQTRVRANRSFVVGRMRAVGGAHLTEDGAALGQDVRNAKGAANFDQLAARHHDFFAAGQTVDGDEYCGGVVVDDGRRLRAGQIDEQLLDPRFTSSPATVREVVFQIGGTAGDAGHRVDRHLRQHRAPEIGVEYRSRRVDDRLQLRLTIYLDALGDFDQNRGVFDLPGGDINAPGDLNAELVEDRPTVTRDILTPQADEPRGGGGLREQAVD